MKALPKALLLSLNSKLTQWVTEEGATDMFTVE